MIFVWEVQVNHKFDDTTFQFTLFTEKFIACFSFCESYQSNTLNKKVTNTQRHLVVISELKLQNDKNLTDENIQ